MNDLRLLEIQLVNTETAKTNVYAHFPVVNEDSMRRWIRETFPNKPVTTDRLHVTVCYSSADVNLKQVSGRKGFILSASHDRKLKLLGEGDSIVMTLGERESRRFQETWQMFRDAGASWDYPTYIPHITLGKNWGYRQSELDKIHAYDGMISFGSMITAALRADK